MPKGKHFTTSQKNDIINAYLAKNMTVNQICAKYGLGRRTVYQWIEKTDVPRRGMGKKTNCRRAVYMSRDEIELILLMMLESKSILNGKYTPYAKTLEEKLLNVADELEEYDIIERSIP